MTEITELNRDNYDAIVTRDGIVIVDAWAPWCGPCRQFAPVFVNTSVENPGHVFAKLDTQAQPELMASLNITHIPTLMVYRDGILIFHKAISPSAEDLADIVRQAESLDMEAVKAIIAAED